MFLSRLKTWIGGAKSSETFGKLKKMLHGALALLLRHIHTYMHKYVLKTLKNLAPVLHAS